MHKMISKNAPYGYVSVTEFARATKMPQQNVRYLCRAGKLTHTKVGCYYFIARYEVTKHMPLDVFDYGRGCGPAPEVC